MREIMRVFISYKYTRVPMSTLNTTVVPLVKKIRESGFEVFCNLERDDVYMKEKWSAKAVMDEALAELDKCDCHITFAAPNTTMGEGMLIELGYAKKMGIPTLLLIPDEKKSISAKAVVDNIIVYKNMQDLFVKLESIKNDKNNINLFLL